MYCNNKESLLAKKPIDPEQLVHLKKILRTNINLILIKKL